MLVWTKDFFFFSNTNVRVDHKAYVFTVFPSFLINQKLEGS